VERGSYATATESLESASTAPWDSPEPCPSFFNQMEQLFGEISEPDPLFFVDSWTIGVAAAAQSFQARQQVRVSDPWASRPFDFSMPLNFVNESTQDAYPRSSTHAGFTNAFREAYGVSGSPSSDRAASATRKAVPADQSSIPAPETNQDIAVQSACLLLGVTLTSTREQIKTAYRQLVRRYHPDRVQQGSDDERRIATDRMIAINQAYHLLGAQSFGASS
ncbi:MAG: J domain-containing protein, partial [Terracidiphilus sp.]